MLLTARAVSAEEALRVGLIGHVVPDGKALEEALRISSLICDNGPLAVEAIKQSVREPKGCRRKTVSRELEIGWPVFATSDAEEGQRAFAEKRKADFKRA